MWRRTVEVHTRVNCSRIQEVWGYDVNYDFRCHHYADDEIYEFNYPVEAYPAKVTSFNFDKNPEIKGKLMGIKVKYLIFESCVINIRKYQGYEVIITWLIPKI